MWRNALVHRDWSSVKILNLSIFTIYSVYCRLKDIDVMTINSYKWPNL